MPGYNAILSVYYCKQSESPGDTHRIAPAPMISISPEIHYANDNVVGYTYNITLNGYANALRKELNASSVDYGLSNTVSHIGDLREIFNTNGGNLYIKQGSQNLLVAKGATIRSLQFNESDNRWFNYAPFSVELEFNEIDLISCSNNPLIDCTSSIFHQNNGNIIANNLVDIRQYKIKEFNDKWTFTIDNQIYENFNGLNNNVFRVSYSLSATGKNYYVNGNVVPGWQQARLFVQDRLYKQVYSLINGQLQLNASQACSATKDITQIHEVDISSPRSSGLLQGFSTLKDGIPTYDIYNEKINCSTSESDGTFSVTYEAILKKYDSSLSPLTNASLHTYTKNVSVTSQQSVDASISVEGTIQGLIRGGFINYAGNDFILPQNGIFITSNDGAETKYSNALSYYTTKVGSNSDLLDSMKNLLGITKYELLINQAGYPSASSFTLDHNYHDGSIRYNATYEKSVVTAIEKGFTNVSITREDPVDIVQEFIIPGRIKGPIIQKLNMKTSRRISVTIEGASPDNKKCDSLSDLCSFIPSFSIQNFEQLLVENNNWVKTKEDYSTNALDGSYSISLEYIVRTCQNG